MVKILPKLLTGIEIFGLIVSVAGYVFKVLHLTGANEMLMTGLLTLALTYFLSAFTLRPIPNNGKAQNFVDALMVILPKVMFIALAVSINGFLFAILHLAGANEMLLVGGLTLIITVFESMAFILMKRERMEVLKAPLIRSVAVLLLFLISYLK